MYNAPTIELHYYLSGGAHSMDAALRNRCEAELLALFREVSAHFGVSVEIEAEALSEGGLKEVWKWLGDNASQIGIILAIITIVISLIPESESEQAVLDRELTKLSIEEKQLQIDKLRRELRDLDAEAVNDVHQAAVDVLRCDPKIVVRRSNFYKNLAGYEKVESLGITPFKETNHPLFPERTVPKGVFRRFILGSHALPPLIIENAKIEIVSPVLREGNYKWKGIFQGEIIGFSMHDKDFRGQVLREEITFQHGTFIECVLNINRGLDEVGDVEITGHVVTTVIHKYDDRQAVQTLQGRRYQREKRLRESQKDLFEDQ